MIKESSKKWYETASVLSFKAAIMDKFVGTVQRVIFLTHFLSHILGSFATPSPPNSMLLGGNEVKIGCRAESGPGNAQH